MSDQSLSYLPDSLVRDAFIIISSTLMGVSFGGPKIENLINGYVDKVPTLPQGISSGQQVAEYYEKKHRFSEVSLFSGCRFEQKINETAQNAE